VLTAADIDRFFQQYGWIPTYTADNRWQVTFAGDTAAFTITILLTEDWLSGEIDLSAYRQMIPPAEALLMVQAGMPLAKFAIDPQGNFVLRAELPTEGLVYSHFTDCLGSLSHYADFFLKQWMH
jgi:hypothetical protein